MFQCSGCFRGVTAEESCAFSKRSYFMLCDTCWKNCGSKATKVDGSEHRFGDHVTKCTEDVEGMVAALKERSSDGLAVYFERDSSEVEVRWVKPGSARGQVMRVRGQSLVDVFKRALED